MALEDAVVLAASVRDHAPTTVDLPAALRAYEQARRARVGARQGRRAQQQLKTPGRWAAGSRTR
jgi:2-polyprenyl-6-methoxyphenol hydroxylase-like FAD-dependent oxidoreductase